MFDWACGKREKIGQDGNGWHGVSPKLPFEREVCGPYRATLNLAKPLAKHWRSMKSSALRSLHRQGTGKSYLLNLLLGQLGEQEAENSTKECALVHARIQKGYKQFRLALSRAALSSVGSSTQACHCLSSFAGKIERSHFGFFEVRYRRLVDVGDCEGFGSTESDKTRDAKLMSLCMLLSSVFLLNTKASAGVLSEGLFNALSLVCSLATHVEQGQDASKPALLWLLRDFLLELVDEDGRRLTPDEYLESSLRKTPPEGADSKRSQAAAV
eukprot:Skav218370  [mRNA]  locus=scaffold2066:201450:203850:+ [translate_table: standard]